MKGLKTISPGNYQFRGASGTRYAISRAKKGWKVSVVELGRDAIDESITHCISKTYDTLRAAQKAVNNIQCKTVNMMSKKETVITEDTPWFCNPASESYWSA